MSPLPITTLISGGPPAGPLTCAAASPRTWRTASRIANISYRRIVGYLIL